MSAPRRKPEGKDQKAEKAMALHLMLVADSVDKLEDFLNAYWATGQPICLREAVRWHKAARTNLTLLERWLKPSGIRRPKSAIPTGGVR